MARKKKHEEHANHERWLVSYADFITLLFAFFVVMYSVSEIDKKKMVAVTESVAFAFGMPGHDRKTALFVHERGGPSPMSDRADALDSRGVLLPEGERIELKGLLTRIAAELTPIVRQGALPEGVQLTISDRGLLIRLADVKFFDAGGAMLRPEALPALDAIGARIRETGRSVKVQGHSDNMTLGRGSTYATNWELAATRAVSVVRYFHEATKIPPEKLTVSTFGQYRPIADNKSPAGRARNRRIDILVEASPEALSRRSKRWHRSPQKAKSRPPNSGAKPAREAPAPE